MSVSVIDIEVANTTASELDGGTPARVLLDIDGHQTWFSLRVEPFFLPEIDAQLVVAGPELLQVFRGHQRTTHRIQQLVGQAARRAPVHLPQRVAA